MPEVSPEQIRYWEDRERVANFSESVFNDPGLNKDAKRLIKRKYPQLSIPDHDLEEKFDQKLGKFEEERKQREDADKRTKQEAEWKAKRDRTQKEYGYTEEGMGKLEDLMRERNIGDYEVAATFHAAKNPRPSEPTSGHGQPWAFTANDTFREVAQDPEAWARKEFMKAMEIDKERARQQAF